jgi:hypothetical protein
VTFEWLGDRFGHQVKWIDDGRVVGLLTSAESSPATHPPFSPPLQQLHVEHRAGDLQVALLVGMSGHDHWSMSVEVPRQGKCLTFDVACRRGDESLPCSGSRYLLADPDQNAAAPRPGWSAAGGWLLSALPAGDEPAADLLWHQDRVEIVPPRGSQRTVRWKYRIEPASG